MKLRDGGVTAFIVATVLISLFGMRDSGELKDLFEPQKPLAAQSQSMVRVPAGRFVQGSQDGPPQELPVRKVYLNAFWIDRDEVSVRDWERFRKATGHRASKYADDPTLHQPNLPIVGISWSDAVAFCKWAGKRLPTEAEWEKAARGTQGQRYPWGDRFDPVKASLGENTPPPVGQGQAGASPYGVRAMSGGVWEWTHDFWGEFYYRDAPDRNPKGVPSGFLHTIKGGSYRNTPDQLRSATRFRLDGIIRWKILGFRCAKDAEPETKPPGYTIVK